jgi:hypothetical protein
MTFASVTNILLMLLCVSVLVQSTRMIRSFRAVRSGNLNEVVEHLDRATDQARAVLMDLRRLLATEGQASARAIASAEILRDELSVMVGIGNAVADRIVEAADAAKATSRKEASPEAKPAATRSRPKRSRSGRSRTGESKVADRATGPEKVKATPGDGPVLAAVPVQPSASVAILPHLSKAA